MEQGIQGNTVRETITLDAILSKDKKYKLSKPLEVIYQYEEKDGHNIISPILDVWGFSPKSKDDALKCFYEDFHHCAKNLAAMASGEFGVHMIDKVKIFKKLLGYE